MKLQKIKIGGEDVKKIVKNYRRSIKQYDY